MKQSLRKIEDLAQIQSGHQFRGGIQPVDGGDALAVQMSVVEADMPIPWGELTPVALPSGPGRRTPRYLEEGDVLLAARGLRYFAVLCEDMPSGAQIVASPHFFVIRVQDDGLIPAFLCWQLNQEPLQKHLNMIAAGGTQRALPIREFKLTEIAVPSLEQQQKVLDLHEEVLRERAALNALLENRKRLMSGLAASLYQQAEQQEQANG